MRHSFLFFTFFSYLSSLAQPLIVKDIHPGSTSSTASNWVAFTGALGNTFYFAANDGTHGIELWKSDGTEAGTVLVKDLNPSTTTGGIESIVLAHDGYVWFEGRTSGVGTDLWRTDGTDAGTVRLADLCGCTVRDPAYLRLPSDMLPWNGKLYFRGGSSDVTLSGDGLWVTDGTAAGTYEVKYLGLNPHEEPLQLLEFDGKLYFHAQIGSTDNRELWISDGTPAGTSVLKELNPGTDGSFPSSLRATDNGDKFFFHALTAANGRELWVSDGTEAGTMMVKDINPGTADGVYEFYDFNNAVFLPDGRLLFPANDGTNGTELWVSDGTEAGTVMLKNINPGPNDASPMLLGAVTDGVVFRADSSGVGRELWFTDGTTAGTHLVLDNNPGTGSSFAAATLASISYQGKVYYNASTPAIGRELWVTDGTAAGTQLVGDINPGTAGADPRTFHVVGNNLMFFADNAQYGREPWKYELFTVGTHQPGTTPSVHVYPTVSADGRFTVALDEPGDYRLEVYDALSRIQYTAATHAGRHDLALPASVTAGAYVLRVIAENGRGAATSRHIFIVR